MSQTWCPEVGRRFLTRSGDVTTPMAYDPSLALTHPFYAHVRGLLRTWTERGVYITHGEESAFDLVAPAEEVSPVNAKPTPDPVNSPQHYTAGGIECLDYLRAKLTKEQFIGYCRGNAIKYLSRAGLKGPAVEDYAKAGFYCNAAKNAEAGG